jgi:hypothetical protein
MVKDFSFFILIFQRKSRSAPFEEGGIWKEKDGMEMVALASEMP